jgi:hypothetical protein
MKKFITVVLVILMLSGCSSDSDKNRVLARFVGGVLTEADVDAHLKRMKRDSRFRDKPELLTREFAFEHALNMEMIIARGLELDLHRDPVIRDELHGFMSDLFMRLLQDQLIEPVDRDQISEEEMVEFYENNREQYQQPVRYHLHAFSIDAARSEEIRATLDEDTLSFAEAAARYALKSHERESGGNTGKRTLRRFQPSWRNIVAGLEVGEVSGPHLIDEEWYMLLLSEKTEPYHYSFEERREYIRNDVVYSRYQEQWRRVYDELRRKYDVKIDETNLKNYSTDASAAGEAAMLATAGEEEK